MPRTKVNKKVLAKRNRRSSTEEKLEAKLRNFEMFGKFFSVLNLFLGFNMIFH